MQKPLGDKSILEAELEGFGIRLNKKPPAITVRKKVWRHTLIVYHVLITCSRKEKGGIAITNTVPLTNLDHDDIKGILSEYKVRLDVTTTGNLIKLALQRRYLTLTSP